MRFFWEICCRSSDGNTEGKQAEWHRSVNSATASSGAEARVLKAEDQPRSLERPYLRKPGNMEQW